MATLKPIPDPGLPRWLDALRRNRGMIAPAGFAILMIVLLVPLPPIAMDMLICVNIAVAVLVLLTTMTMNRPLDFSIFPSLLLATTLLRLVLKPRPRRRLQGSPATSSAPSASLSRATRSSWASSSS
jgi:flagellar biosynthesis protein FlhA